MKSSHRFSVLIIVFLSVLAGAEDKHRQLAREYLEVSNQESMLNISINSMIDEIQLQDPKANRQEIRQFLESYMGWEVLKEPMISSATHHLTMEQLQDIIGFYKTQSGKALADKSVDMAAELTKQMIANMPPMQNLGI